MSLELNEKDSLLPLCREPNYLKFGFVSPCFLHLMLPIALDSYLLVFAILIWLNKIRKTRIRRQYRNLNDVPEHSENESEDDNDESHHHYRPLNENFDRTISISKIAVTFIISLHAFDVFGIISNIFLKSDESAGIETKLPLNFILVFSLPIIAWSFSIPFYFFEDWKFKFQLTVHGFWIWSFFLMIFETYTRYIYYIHKDELGDESKLFLDAPGFAASFYLRFAFHIVLLVCIGFFIHIWKTKNYWYTQIPINPTSYYQSRQPGHRDENYRDRNRPSWRTLKFWSNTPIPDISVTTNEKYKLPNTVGEFYQKFKKLIPFVWPCGRENLSLQILIILCVITLIIGRVVNVFVPIQYKRIINSFGNLSKGGIGVYFGKEANDTTPAEIPWKDIVIFVFLKFLQGGVGLLNNAQNFMWIPVGQYTTREISISMFKHLHSLSLRFHLHRKTGEILRVQDRGVSSIITLLSSILFNILPTLVDIAVACAYFTLMFDATFGIIVFMTMALFIITTIIITEWRNKYRRWTNLLDNAMEAKAVDSLLNFETVKYYNAEDFEADQYCDAIDEYQKAALKSNMTSTLLNLLQNIIIQTGLLIGCFICALRIIRLEGMTVGDFVLYLSYITQLYGPLNWFGNYYRAIQKNFVDMEKMIDLFQEPVEVKDKPGAVTLEKNKEAEVEFRNVFFSYDPRLPALKDITFTIKPGSTVALVGPSGSGKSTILRLLFRFYDVDGGSILINGQDIRDVTQKSLRSNIGVVSQDTMLFNDTIRYNIRYGRCDATDEEVEEAAKLAQVHDKIMAMPDGYDTKVGERGLRLSGGEKQRIAIARTFLKNSSIILLDEATSALDTRTERHIQQAISEMTRDRTVLVIAHRLSTIIGADLILVVKDGKIVERGSHQQLLGLCGEYYKMWQQQLRNENAKLKKKNKKNKETTTVKKRGGISGLAFGSGAFVGIGMGLDTGMSNIEKTTYEKEDIQSERDDSLQEEDFNSNKTTSETENESECITADDSENNYSTNLED